jgi:uncharacterized protein DUF1153
LHLEGAIVLFRRLGDYAAVMAKSAMSRNPTEDGVLPQIKNNCRRLAAATYKCLGPAARGYNRQRGAQRPWSTSSGYELSIEEFFTWQRAIEGHGVAGFRIIRPQIFRDASPARLEQRRH